MTMTEFVESAPRERILKGEKGWWLLGPGGYAKLADAHLTADGGLLPQVERTLREKDILAVPPYQVYTLTVLTSTDCNLGCGYCFQNTAQDPTGGNRPPRLAHNRLKPETTTSILKFAGARMAEAGLDDLSIMLFGGEPLLNPKGCRDLLTRARDYGLKYATMTSNGTLMTPLLARQLAELGLTSVQITFDGAREQHDHIRIRRSGDTGTFDTIVSNIARASELTDIRWTLRVNVSHHNHAGIGTLVEQLGSALDTSRCTIYFARVGDVGLGYGNDLMHTDGLVADFGAWQRRALQLGFTVPRPQAHTPCQTCSFRDGKYGAVVNANGDLASCWETAGKPGWQVGTAEDGYLSSEETLPRWRSCEDHYRYSESENVLTAFRDRVDAALMDHLRELGLV